MVIEFDKNREKEYLDWLNHNRQGYVFNRFGFINPDYNKLHRADCRTLRDIRHDFKKTSYRKICSLTCTS